MRIYVTTQQRRVVEKGIVTLPIFKFVSMNGNPYNHQSLPEENGNIIFNFFSPNCEHCQYMATQYIKNQQKLKNATILMITTADSISTTKFYKDYQLNRLPNIVMLRDPQYKFYKIFGTGVVPSFFLYKDKVLVKKIIGETKIDNLLN